jgi:hypothetical protein
MVDPRNALSLACALAAVYTLPDGREVNKHLVLNLDTTSILLGKGTQPAIICAASRKVLKAAHRAPAVTSEQRQARTIGFTAVINAAEEMVCGVFAIKDRDLTESSLHLVSSFIKTHRSLCSWTSRKSCLFGWGRRHRRARSILRAR